MLRQRSDPALKCALLRQSLSLFLIGEITAFSQKYIHRQNRILSIRRLFRLFLQQLQL